MTFRTRAAISALLLLVPTACGDDDDDGGDAAETTVAEDATALSPTMVVTMMPDAPAGAEDAAIEACGDLPGIGEIEKTGDDPDVFEIDIRQATYEQQLDLVNCLGDQPGIQSAVGAT